MPTDGKTQTTAGEGYLDTIVNEMLAGMIGCRASDIRSDDIAQCNFDVVDTATRIFAAIAPLIRAAERERCAKIVEEAAGEGDSALADSAGDAFNAGSHVTMNARIAAFCAVIAAAILGRGEAKYHESL
jgi:hypothetical protein